MKLVNTTGKLCTLAFAAVFTGVLQAETGNSLVFVDQENNRVVTVDRIGLATLPPSERAATVSGLNDELSEGRIGDSPSSSAGYTAERQQDSCGSLTGKSFDIQFAQLAAEPELSQTLQHKNEKGAMQKLDKSAGIFYVAAPGVWGQNYGGSTWVEPGVLSEHQDNVCNGATRWDYNQRDRSYAIWESKTAVKYNTSVSHETKLARAQALGAEFSVTGKFTNTVGTSSESWGLYRDRYWDPDSYEYGGRGSHVHHYFENTMKATTSDTVEYEILYPLTAVKADVTGGTGSPIITFPRGGVYAGLKFGASINNSFEAAVRNRQHTHIGLCEMSNAIVVHAETGVKVVIEVGKTKIQGELFLGYQLETGSCTGTRDFDFFCVDTQTQFYRHDGYRRHNLYFKKSAELVFGKTKVKVSHHRNLYSEVKPGAFQFMHAPATDHSTLDYLM